MNLSDDQIQRFAVNGARLELQNIFTMFPQLRRSTNW